MKDRSIFSYNSNNSIMSKPEVSHEMIGPQLNDSVLFQLDKLFEELLIKFNKRSGKKDIFVTLDAIDRVITERFGYRFKHILSPGSGAYACLPIPPEEYNAMTQRNISDFYNEIRDYNTKYRSSNKTEEIDVMSPSDVEGSDTINRFAGSIEKAFNTMTESLGKGITIDLKNAKISGLNKNYFVYVIMDPDTLVTCELEPKELTAILLHEIGHTFTHIEYSYKNIINTSVLVDTLIDNVRNKNMSPKDSLILAYRTTTGDQSVDKLKNSNTISCYLDITRRFLDNMQLNQQDHAYTDSEQLADQFAGKFGRGKELATGLDKLHTKYSWGSGLAFVFNSPCFTLCMLLIMSVCIIIPFLISLIPLILCMTVFILYYKTYPDESIAEQATYDDIKRRYERIRNEIVRTIRLTNLDKALTKQLLDNLSIVDEIIANAPERSEGPIGKLIAYVFCSGSKLREMKKIEQLVEDLEENDLHIAYNKIKINS